MHVRLHDAKSLRATFAYDPDKIARVKRLGLTWEKDAKEWRGPICLLDRLIAEFPRAHVDPDCHTARLASWRRWIHQHNHAGIFFALDHDGETVVPVGEGVAPVFLHHVAERSAILRPLLADQLWPADPTPSPVRNVEPSHGDRLIWNGMQNASRAEAKRADTIERAKVRQRQAKQLRLEGV